MLGRAGNSVHNIHAHFVVMVSEREIEMESSYVPGKKWELILIYSECCGFTVMDGPLQPELISSFHKDVPYYS